MSAMDMPKSWQSMTWLCWLCTSNSVFLRVVVTNCPQLIKVRGTPSEYFMPFHIRLWGSHKPQDFSPSLRHIFPKYIIMLYSYLLIGTGCFPVPGTFCNVSNYNTSCRFITVCVFFSYVLCSLKCATLCIQMLMCFNKLLLTWLDFDLNWKPNRHCF